MIIRTIVAVAGFVGSFIAVLVVLHPVPATIVGCG